MSDEGADDGRVTVLWLIKGLGPGGAEQLLVNQARVRAAGRFDYRAAYLVPWKDHRVTELESTGIPVTCLEGRHDLDPRWMLRLRSHLLEHPVDVIHNHSPLVASAVRLLVRTLPRQVRPALVYTEHNRWPRHNRWTRLANRATFGLDDTQVAVSEDVIATIPPRRRTKINPIVHGIAVDEVRARAHERAEVRDELGIGTDEVVIGTVANFRKEKDYPTLLEAARITIASSETPIRFVSVGQGPLEHEVRSLHGKLGLGDRFLILGYRPDAVRIMAGFDIFTLSSLHEGLPVSLMDALALGLPVVATSVGGVPQAITHDEEGLMVPPGRPDLLADAFKELAGDDRMRAAMSTAASQRAGIFDMRATTSELEGIYERAASRRRRTPPDHRSER